MILRLMRYAFFLALKYNISALTVRTHCENPATTKIGMKGGKEKGALAIDE